jgi:hypothetical protein
MSLQLLIPDEPLPAVVALEFDALVDLCHSNNVLLFKPVWLLVGQNTEVHQIAIHLLPTVLRPHILHLNASQAIVEERVVLLVDLVLDRRPMLTVVVVEGVKSRLQETVIILAQVDLCRIQVSLVLLQPVHLLKISLHHVVRVMMLLVVVLDLLRRLLGDGDSHGLLLRPTAGILLLKDISVNIETDDELAGLDNMLRQPVQLRLEEINLVPVGVSLLLSDILGLLNLSVEDCYLHSRED